MRKQSTPTAAALLLLVLALAGCAAPQTDWLNNPLWMADRTHRFDGLDAFMAGRSSNGRIVVNDGTLRPVLSNAVLNKTPPTWHWQTRPVETDEPFSELLPSWNPVVTDTSGVKLFVRTRDAETGDWSPWLYTGSWGTTTDAGKDVVDFEHGEVKIDYLVLEPGRPADAFELRVVFENAGDDPEGLTTWPYLRKLVAVVSTPLYDPLGRDIVEKVSSPDPPASYEPVDLDVPYRTQQALPEAMRSRTCSPTSTSMVLAFRGTDGPTLEHAERIYDAEYDIYGNWGRAVARAGELGHDAELARFRSWSQVVETLSAGQPIIASIRFGEGEFPSNPMSSTDGHLIVIRGITAEGDAIVNDPAYSEGGDGIVYKKEELACAWLGRGGVAYLVGERTEVLPDNNGAPRRPPLR